MAQVFISYSSREADQANELVKNLEQAGIRCWISPRDIPMGSDYTDEIPEAIGTCPAFLLLLSPNSQNSKWVKMELTQALNDNRYILPLQIEDFTPSKSFTFLLQNAQIRRYDTAPGQTLAEVISLIRQHAPAPADPAAIAVETARQHEIPADQWEKFTREIMMEPPRRRDLHMIFVIDTSASMSGAPIATLNQSMRNTVDILRGKSRDMEDVQLKLSVLQFGTTPQWSQYPENIETFVWQDLEAGGSTNMGAALTELNKQLSRKNLLSSDTGLYRPIIFFISDGYATDPYLEPLRLLQANRWFARSIKIAVAWGDSADIPMLSGIVGTGEAVVETTDLALFSHLIQFVSVTASTLSCTGSSPVESGGDIMNEVLRTAFLPSGTAAPPPIPWDADESWE